MNASLKRANGFKIYAALFFWIPMLAFGGQDTSLTRKAILGAMHTVNTWTAEHPYIALDRDWIRGTYYNGVMGLYYASKDSAILKQALDWAKLNEWQTGNETSGSNKLTCTQTWMELYFIYKDKSMYSKLETWVNSGATNSPSFNGPWWYEGGRSYVDALYVGPPALVMLAKATGNDEYIKYVNDIYWQTTEIIYDQADSLVYRDNRFIGMKSANGKKVFWARGNGWIMGSFPRIVDNLPDDKEYLTHKSSYIDMFKKMSASIAHRQGKDGFWRANLADSAEFPSPETSGTAFFTYAMAWGIKKGYLDYQTYFPVVKKGWQAMVGTAIQPDGRLGYVQRVGDRPAATDSASTWEYGVGAYLLAGKELLELVEATPTVLSHKPTAQQKWEVYLPNENQISLKLGAIASYQIEILNVDGKTLFQSAWKPGSLGTNTIALNNPLPMGVHFARLRSQGFTSVQKFMVHK